ncbi:MAG: hypothetical protein V3W19_13085 [Desulfatiglandales bacterium]
MDRKEDFIPLNAIPLVFSDSEESPGPWLSGQRPLALTIIAFGPYIADYVFNEGGGDTCHI